MYSENYLDFMQSRQQILTSVQNLQNPLYRVFIMNKEGCDEDLGWLIYNFK